MNSTDADIQEARGIFTNDTLEPQYETLFPLSQRLKSHNHFGYARRILDRLADRSTLPIERAIKVDQQRALCTYKDRDLPVNERFKLALKILRSDRLQLDTTKDPETLGIAGAVYKRKWEVDGNLKNLERSLSFYKRGYEQGVTNDDGYTAVNTAFIYDLLKEANKDAYADDPINNEVNFFENEAKRIREEIIRSLPEHVIQLGEASNGRKWWLFVTLAEAYFGLGQFQSARPWLQKAALLPGVKEWEKETTTRQLARLALFHDPTAATSYANSLSYDVLLELFADNPASSAALRSAFSGKVGLSLSGGGFRASLYHIGVLARLAELDMLRHVEVLSCVSGGSIIGAAYYLEVKWLLESKEDAEITAQDYVEIVKRLSRVFYDGVKRNLRTRILGNWIDNVKMFIIKDFTRTNRLARLYEKELFETMNPALANQPIWMDQLMIHPRSATGALDSTFKPQYHNWRRSAKVPVLILNATTLNTGHNWQFTASWMGESPATIQKIDGNERLRRVYYKNYQEASTRRIRLGDAVAASSCVPGLFPPIVLNGLYPGRSVKLVDGGAHDNQGICGLLEQDCTVLLISDASGQMGSEANPSSSLLPVSLRVNDILMERVRNAQYQDMVNRLQAGLLKGMMFVHLKLDLDVKTVDWTNCEDPLPQPPPLTELTNYRINKQLQSLLANIRTDLDAFHETEAFSLMTSGYLMTNLEYGKYIHGFAEAEPISHKWHFLQIEQELIEIKNGVRLIQLLTNAADKFFKVIKLSSLSWWLNRLVRLFILGGTVWMLYQTFPSNIVIFVILTLANVLLCVWAFKTKLYQIILAIIIISVTLLPLLIINSVIWAFVQLHLIIFDRLYLHLGKQSKE